MHLGVVIVENWLKLIIIIILFAEYEDATTQESILGSPFISDLLKRSAKFHWTEKGHSSFRLIKKKFQKATHGIRE